MKFLNEICYEKEKYMHLPTQTAKNMYYYAQWAGRFVCKKEFSIKRSNLKSFLIIFTTGGSGSLCYNGKEYTLTKNTVAFLDCINEQSYQTKQAPWEFKYVHFYGSDSAKLYKHITSLYGSSVFLCPSYEAENTLARLVSAVKSAADETVCSNYIYRLLMCFIQNKANSEANFNLPVIMRYIAENYADNLNVGTLADSFRFSRSYFSTRFKELSGTNVHEYILSCRIAAAKQMLTDGQKSVADIAYSCGFSSAAVFIRAFKTQTGASPLSYRKHHLPNHL